ncbi:MAG: zinc protease, partial [Paraglaciecola sp.]
MPNKLLFTFFLLGTVLLCIGCSAPLGNSFTEKPSITHPATADFRGLLPISPRIIKGQLDNGMTYLIRQNDTPEKRAEIRLIVKAGSILEDDNQQGFAHFVEHMAFNGTEDFDKQEIIEYVESIGMKFGAHLNAYTSFDETVYKLQLPSDEEGTLEKGIHILENWAHKIKFDALEIDKERGVVLEEMRARQGAGWRIFEKQLPVIYHGSQYALRLPIGNRETLELGAHQDLVRFYKDWYRPELMALVAVGDFDPKQVEALFEKYFSPIEVAPKGHKQKPIYTLADNINPLVTIETDPELTRTTVEIQIKQALTEPVTYQQYYQTLVEHLFIDMLNGRFGEATLAPQAPVIAAGSSFGRFRANKSAFTLAATAKPSKSKEVVTFLLTELNRVLKHGFTPSELARYKQSLLSNLENAAKEIDSTQSSRFTNEYVRHIVRGESIAGIDHYYEIGKKFLPQITLDEINALGETWFTTHNRIVKISAPESDSSSLPSKGELLALIEHVTQQQVTAYKDSQVIQQLVTEKPTAGSIISKVYDKILDSHVWVLSNGVKVVLKQTDFKHDEIQFSAMANGGYSLLAPEMMLKTIMAANIVEMSGISNYSLADITKFSKGKNFWVRTKINNDNQSISGSSSVKDIEHFMQMLHLKFVEPRKDKEAFDSYISRVESSITDRFNSPQGVFSEQIRLKQYSQNLRSVKFDVALVKNQDLDKSYRFYQQRFSNAANFNFVFVGNVDLLQMEVLLSTYVASLPTIAKRDQAIIHDNLRTRGKLTVKVEKGLVPKATVRLNFYGDSLWSHKKQMNLNALEYVLNSILRERIREEKSGVYGINVKSVFSRLRNQYSTSVSFTCDPNRVEELVTEIHKVIETLKAKQTEDKYALNYIAQKLKSRETKLTTNAFWKNYLQLNADVNYQQLGLNEFVSLVESINNQVIKEAANTYINIDDSLTAILVPKTPKAAM